MAAGDALEGLQRTEAALRSYADANGLVLTEEIPWPGYVPAAQQMGPVRHAIWSLAGRFPGGAVGRLRHQAAYGETLGVDIAQQHTIMVARMPETVGYVPMLCVRPAELMSGLYYWGGDQRPRDSQKFESQEMNRRYVVDISKGQGQNWLWQLFSPALIDWIAHETPQDFGFKLETGVFTCECPQWRGQGRMDGEVDAAYLDLLSGCAGKVASRIRDEVLEEVGTGSAGAPDSAQAYVDWVAAPKHGRIVGAILALTGADEADDSIKQWASERGMETESPASFHARNIGLPLPGAASDVATGTLPGTKRRGSVAWISFSSDVDMERNYVAVVGEVEGGGLPTAWVDAGEAAVPGFGGEIPKGALDKAAPGGYGVSTAGDTACIYFEGASMGAWPSGADIDIFIPTAASIIDGLA
jgi:hypothetical protein